MFDCLIYGTVSYIIITYFQMRLGDELAARQQPFLPKIEWLDSIMQEHLRTNQISLLCVVKFVALADLMLGKTMSK